MNKKILQNKSLLKNSALLIALLCTSACTMTNLKNALGAEKNSPDEFMVETRKPLIIPENFNLPSAHEAGIPNLERNNEEAKKVLFGNATDSKVALTKTESSLLQKTEANAVDNNVKKQVYLEHKDTAGKGVFGVTKGGFLEKILDPFGKNTPKDPELDLEAEKARVAKAIKEGKKVTGDAAIK
jgi:hypothetical protein